MRTARLIINPSSGRSEGASVSEEAQRILRSSFDVVEAHVSTSADNAMALARDARENRFDAVFAMGGDGTVSTVVRGLLDGAGEKGEIPILGILPGGTGNGFARTLGLPSNAVETIEALDFDTAIPLDACFANGIPFTYTLTGGSLPEGIREVPSKDKARFGFLAYVASELQRIGDDRHHRLRISVDGDTMVEDINSFAALSANTLVNQFISDADTEIDNGLIYLLALKDASFASLLSLIPDAVTQSIDENDNVMFLCGSHIRVECLDGDMRCGMDGDDGPLLPVDLTVQPGRLRTFPLCKDLA
ncbi:MAG: diacylglycerol kinase family lipid kinase [Berryella intestinalis]|uniref:diacylglycerol/lipid kinase family protein n=1 Tax=Berryella intestinalis TaxID=1531429 RepID=UPI002A764C96|nr:diacylglycerol kinase family protein [Berryella intestinalis]MDY3128414.1 diacylglycerol kinase family lipid kinase [Berryella intestinalis]